MDSAVAYSANTWYKLQLEFDTAADTYNFTVLDNAQNELFSAAGIAFGTPVTNSIDRIMFRTSDTFDGNAYLDEVLIRAISATEPGVTVGTEATQIFTDAWSRNTKILNATVGNTIRWRYSAKDASDNWTTSEIYTFLTQAVDTPPTVTLNAPANRAGLTTPVVDFKATCSDETDISQIALWGDWGGTWTQIDSRSGPGLNGIEQTFTKTVPDGDWTWNIRCQDNTSHSTWGTPVVSPWIFNLHPGGIPISTIGCV